MFVGSVSDATMRTTKKSAVSSGSLDVLAALLWGKRKLQIVRNAVMSGQRESPAALANALVAKHRSVRRLLFQRTGFQAK